MYKIMVHIGYALLLLLMIGYNTIILTKGYMALKHDLGYEAEHQRPENSMGQQTVGTSDERSFLSQNYAMTTNPGRTYNSIENAQPASTGFYHEGDFAAEEDFHPFARDIEEQTRFVVDHPYDHEFE